MNFKPLFFIASMWLSHTVIAQQKADLYVNMNEYNTAVFSTVDGIGLVKRSRSDIKMNGGNDYKIVADDASIKSDLKRFYWGVKYNDTLYLNCKVLMKSKWYAKVLYSDARYMYFRAGVGEIYDPNRDSRIMTSVLFGAVGGAFAGASAAMERYDYLLNRQTENVYLIDKNLLLYMLKDNPELHRKVYNTRSMFTQEEIIDYLSQMAKAY